MHVANFSFHALPSCLFHRSAAQVIWCARCIVCLALNGLFTGYPENDPALSKVLRSVGLDGKKTILHSNHPVVVGREDILSLCPPDTCTKSLVQDGHIPVNAQFTFMLSKFFSPHTYISGS